MTEVELQQRLETMGTWRPGLRLEPFELLTNQAPAGALEQIQTVMLLDEQYAPARDGPGRPWRPVLVVGDDVWLDADPAQFDRLLAASGYWDRPADFGDLLLLQFHRFALDFYQGYQVREERFARKPERLVVTGEATRGGPRFLERYTYETRAGRDEPATFTVRPVDDMLY